MFRVLGLCALGFWVDVPSKYDRPLHGLAGTTRFYQYRTLQKQPSHVGKRHVAARTTGLRKATLGFSKMIRFGLDSEFEFFRLQDHGLFCLP